MRKRLTLMGCGALALFAYGAASARAQDDHPFSLVNVIALDELFSLSVEIDQLFDPTAGPPPNWDAYKSDPRLGTQPSAVAVHGTSLWVGGFYNGANYPNRESWYASIGVGEMRNILTTSGFGGDAVKYVSTHHFGPAIQNTNWVSGLDYDPTTQTLYVAFDETVELIDSPHPSDSPLQPSYIAAVDADPVSATYGQFNWKLEDPFVDRVFIPPFIIESPGDRFRAGVAVDPLHPEQVWVPILRDDDEPQPTFGTTFRRFDVNDVDAVNNTLDRNLVDKVNVKDATAACPQVFYRSINFDDVTGDMYLRNTNAADRVPRHLADTTPEFLPEAVEIIEPDNGNLLADTEADPLTDDVQLVAVGLPVTPGEAIVGAGTNGLIDTLPAGDDTFAPINTRPVGNRLADSVDGSCDDDPVDGLPNGIAQGQGIAIVSASSFPGLSEDLVVVNSRPASGAGNLTEAFTYGIDGTRLARVDLPCTPIADETNSTGIGILDLDYDSSSQTLVIVQFEEQKAYVFKPKTEYPRYDFTRNQTTDMRDFSAMQNGFTGTDFPGPLSLNLQRLNTDSDCDLDFSDFTTFIGETWGDMPPLP